MRQQKFNSILLCLLTVASSGVRAQSTSSYETLNEDGLLIIKKESFVNENIYGVQIQRQEPKLQIIWKKQTIDQAGLSPFVAVLNKMAALSTEGIGPSITVTENSIEINNLEDVNLTRGPADVDFISSRWGTLLSSMLQRLPAVVRIKGLAASELLAKSVELGASLPEVRSRRISVNSREFLRASHSSFSCGGYADDVSNMTCSIRLAPQNSSLGIQGVFSEDRITVYATRIGRDRRGRQTYIETSNYDRRYAFAVVANGRILDEERYSKGLMAYPAYSGSDELFGRGVDGSELKALPSGVHVSAIRVSKSLNEQTLQLSVSGTLANNWAQTIKASAEVYTTPYRKTEKIEGVVVSTSYNDLRPNISTRCQTSSSGVSQCSALRVNKFKDFQK